MKELPYPALATFLRVEIKNQTGKDAVIPKKYLKRFTEFQKRLQSERIPFSSFITIVYNPLVVLSSKQTKKKREIPTINLLLSDYAINLFNSLHGKLLTESPKERKISEARRFAFILEATRGYVSNVSGDRKDISFQDYLKLHDLEDEFSDLGINKKDEILEYVSLEYGFTNVHSFEDLKKNEKTLPEF